MGIVEKRIVIYPYLKILMNVTLNESSRLKAKVSLSLL